MARRSGSEEECLKSNLCMVRAGCPGKAGFPESWITGLVGKHVNKVGRNNGQVITCSLPRDGIQDGTSKSLELRCFHFGNIQRGILSGSLDMQEVLQRREEATSPLRDAGVFFLLLCSV